MVFFGSRAEQSLKWLGWRRTGWRCLLVLFVCVCGRVWAQSSGAVVRTVDFVGPLRGWSTVGEVAGESSSVVREEGGGGSGPKRTWRDVVPVYEHPVRPFSEFGASVKVSTLGPGFDLVTPLLRHWNLRASANFFDFGLVVMDSGVNYDGELHLRSGGASLDWFPRGGGFHISPGFMIFNPRIGGGIMIPGGMVYTLNDQTFTSSATDPIHGDAQLAFSRRLAPMLAVGFANIIPRSGKRWTIPVEVGLAYVGRSAISIKLAGTACQPDGCEDVATDPASQNDLQEEIRDINDDLKRAQFFPVLSVGIGYRF